MKLLEINESLLLDKSKSYPFRDSLTSVARCGMCEHINNLQCVKGHEIIFPTIAKEHDCKDYEYKRHLIPSIPDDKIQIFHGLIDRYKECKKCHFQFFGYCSGYGYFSFTKKEEKCQFFVHVKNRCVHAIPYMQYGTTIQNHYCDLNPNLRSDSMKNGWKWACLNPLNKNHACYCLKNECVNCEKQIEEISRKCNECKGLICAECGGMSLCQSCYEDFCESHLRKCTYCLDRFCDKCIKEHISSCYNDIRDLETLKERIVRKIIDSNGKKELFSKLLKLIKKEGK